MSALGLDDRDDPRGVLAYARRQRRADDETTIRPVLERLSRTEGRVPGPRLVRKVRAQELPPSDAGIVAKSALPSAVRLAAAAGVLALIGAAGAGYFLVVPAENRAAPASAPMTTAATLPKPVQTVIIQRSDRLPIPQSQIEKTEARLPAAPPLPSATVAAAVAAPPAPLPAIDPSTSPLKAWAEAPTDPSGPSWSPTAQQAADETPPAAAAPPAQSAPARKAAPVHHARHIVRHQRAHERPHRVARGRAHAAPAQAAAASQPAATEQAQPQPVKRLPLQAAIDRLVGNKTANGAASPQQ